MTNVPPRHRHPSWDTTTVVDEVLPYFDVSRFNLFLFVTFSPWTVLELSYIISSLCPFSTLLLYALYCKQHYATGSSSASRDGDFCFVHGRHSQLQPSLHLAWVITSRLLRRDRQRACTPACTVQYQIFDR